MIELVIVTENSLLYQDKEANKAKPRGSVNATAEKKQWFAGHTYKETQIEDVDAWWEDPPKT